METTEVITMMRDRLVKRFHPRRIILFGSHARGEARWDSDVDLLVVLDSCEDKRQTTVSMFRALTTMPSAKDIVVTTPDEIARRGDLVGTVLWWALREGKLIYERS